jgi:hypothetical protein
VIALGAVALAASAPIAPASSASPASPAEGVRAAAIGAVTADPTSGPTADVADIPAGFTDGVPVGGGDAAPSPASRDDPVDPGAAQPQADPVAGTAQTKAATQRYFGREPWQAIQAAAAATPRTCSISSNGLTALTVSPVFKESSAATSASTAPSPMTLSRYDEWNGIYATTSNQSANYGLYAFRNPNTPYKQAFWHPGIGIWQYDSAGVGAPFTAIERMDVRVVAADVAKGMAARYCNPSASLIGHGAPFSAQERRYAAWSPWGYPCTLCEQEFQSMTSTSPVFARISLVDGISVTGGAEPRTCTLLGVAGTVRCWYVNPSVGVIEGATGWARIAPLDGGSPSSTPTPIARPFYVIDRGAKEERHWLRTDTGYAIDISGSRTIGTNERPRANQAGSGITWSSTSGLCDLTTGHGACVPPAPAGLTLTSASVGGLFRPIALDAHGDGRGDVLWYAPGAAADHLWSGTGSGRFTDSSLAIGGTFDDVIPLDVDGDGDDEIVWYNRSTGAAYLWLANGRGGWQSIKLTRPKGLRPFAVDTDGNGRDEVFWYGPGSLPDALWSWNGASFTSRTQSVGGSYRPVRGDFDGNGRTDVFWYAPGSAPDHLWLSTGLGTHVDRSVPVSGTYTPLVGDLDGDRADDIVWFAPGAASDHLFFGAPGGVFSTRSVSVGGSYQPVVADLEGDGRDDIIWYTSGPGADSWWRWGTDRSITSAALVANGPHRPVVGGFSTGGADGVLWYAAGPAPDGVWWH